jgi:hypothetical protein
MIALICFVLPVFASPFKSKSLENAAPASSVDRSATQDARQARTHEQRSSVFLQMYRWFPSVLKVVRPRIETEFRALIQRMSFENALWSAPAIHRAQARPCRRSFLNRMTHLSGLRWITVWKKRSSASSVSSGTRLKVWNASRLRQA